MSLERNLNRKKKAGCVCVKENILICTNATFTQKRKSPKCQNSACKIERKYFRQFINRKVLILCISRCVIFVAKNHVIVTMETNICNYMNNSFTVLHKSLLLQIVGLLYLNFSSFLFDAWLFSQLSLLPLFSEMQCVQDLTVGIFRLVMLQNIFLDQCQGRTVQSLLECYKMNTNLPI